MNAVVVTPANSKTDASVRCPYCESTIVFFRHRAWWQKLFHPNKKLCYCHDCEKKFWRESS